MKKTELFFAFILLPVDVAMAIASFLVGYFIRDRIDFGLPYFAPGVSGYLMLSFYLLPVIISLYAINGLYYTKINKSFISEFYRIAESNSVAMSLLVMFLFFAKISDYSRIVIVITWIVGIIFVFIGRRLIRIIQVSLIQYGIGVRNTIVIGSNELASFASKEIKKNTNLGYKFVGSLDDTKSDDIKIIGKISDFQKIIEKYQIDEIIVCDYKVPNEIFEKMLDYCSDHHVTIKYVPALAAELFIKTSESYIGSMPVFEIKTTPLDGWGRIVKRGLDIIFSSLFLILLFPIMLIITIIIKVTSKGPLFYTHTRVGRDNRGFKFYKFRSMHTDMCDWKEEGKWTTEKDNTTRVTSFGRILRKCNLDELPQLWNILIGDMSFVGPRPELPKLVEKFSSNNPEYLKRHRVKTGLTGWAQVNGLKGDTSISDRVRYDIYYIENWSIWLDFKIILLTIWILLYELVKGKYEYRSGS